MPSAMADGQDDDTDKGVAGYAQIDAGADGVGCHHVAGGAPKGGQQQIADDQIDAQGEQRLTLAVAQHPLEQGDLQQKGHHGGHYAAGEDAQQPAARALLDCQANVGAHQVEDAVAHVDHLHQAKHQGQTAGAHKEQASVGDAVHCDDKRLIHPDTPLRMALKAAIFSRTARSVGTRSPVEPVT